MTADRALTRRGFLAAGTAVVSAALLPGGVWPPLGGLEALASSGSRRLRVGYVPGSTGAESPAALFDAGRTRVVDAAAARRAGQRFGGTPARITVHGFTPAALESVGTNDVMVDALLPVASAPGGIAPFFAWTHRGGPQSMTSGRARFVLGSGRGLRVGIRVTTHRRDVGEAEESTTVFGSVPDGTLPALQPGVFLLGLDDIDWVSAGTLPRADDPAWAQLASLVMTVEPAVA